MQKSIERTTVEKQIDSPKFREEEKFSKLETTIILGSFPFLLVSFFIDFLRSL
jgi:hypothetical protein